MSPQVPIDPIVRDALSPAPTTSTVEYAPRMSRHYSTSERWSSRSAVCILPTLIDIPFRLKSGSMGFTFHLTFHFVRHNLWVRHPFVDANFLPAFPLRVAIFTQAHYLRTRCS